MVQIEYPIKKVNVEIPPELLVGKRHLTEEEIEILEKNLNHNDDWNNFYVSDKEGEFDPSVVHLCFFYGYIIVGRLVKANLKFL